MTETQQNRLKEVLLFDVFTNEELEKLNTLFTEKSVPAFENIIIEGELSWGLFLVVEGQVGIFKSAAAGGKLYDIGHLNKGGFFGEMSLIDEAPRSASIRALTDCQLAFLSKDAFWNFMNEVPDRKLRFFGSCTQQLVKRLRELNDNYVISQYQLWKSALKMDKKEVA